MRLKMADNNKAILEPETIQEAGLFHWLAERFGGRPVKIEFGTTSGAAATWDQYPTVWMHEVSPKRSLDTTAPKEAS